METNRMFDVEFLPDGEFVLRFRRPKMKEISEEAKVHGKAAAKEGLLLVRSMLDSVIKAMEDSEKEHAEKVAQKIEVK